MKDLRKYEPDRDLKGMEGTKIAPKGLREGGATGPRLKKMPSNCHHEEGCEICVTGKNQQGTHIWEKKILMKKTHTSDSGASILDF